MEPIAFPDAEAAAVAYLNPLLAGLSDAARAATQVPKHRPPRFVRVIRTGGGERDLAHEDAWLTVECWDANSEDAFALARIVAGLLRAWELVPRGGIISGPVNLPDPTSGSPRYVLTVIVRQRAEVLEAS